MNFIIQLGLFLQTAVQMGTHILLATSGGIMCEKAGNTNLGIEGMMLMGASVGYWAGYTFGSPVIAVLAAGLAGAAGALIYAVITVTLRGNQVVTGLVLTIFGTGVAGFLSKTISSHFLPETISSAFASRAVPGLSRIPVLGTALFVQSIYIYLSIIIAVLLYLYLRFTRWGLNLRSVGENPAAADASGINVTLYKYVHILMGGFLAGLGGAYLSLVFVPRWQENITAGAGWIAVAFIIFSTWNPLQAIAASYAFGALKGLAFKCQNLVVFGHKLIISTQILDMIPYLATIIVLVCMTTRRKKENQSPEALGNPYFREER
jgi:general nucleoside transport system permease protein